jgi:hypothetical protein
MKEPSHHNRYTTLTTALVHGGLLLAIVLLVALLLPHSQDTTPLFGGHALAAPLWSGRAMPVDIIADAPPFASDRLSFDLSGVSGDFSDRTLGAYLLHSATDAGRACSGLTVSNGAITAPCDFPDHNLIGRYDTLSFFQEKVSFQATLPAGAFAHLQPALHTATDTPQAKSYGRGLLSEAGLLADHAGFALAAAETGSLVNAKRHTEHVLNILYGSADPRYGDQDNDGVTTNPGDGYGLLRYRQKLAENLQAAATASDTTTNIQSRVAQVTVTLTNIGDGSSGDGGWATLVIEKAEALLMAGDSTAAQSIALQLAALASRIELGEELNENGEIEPIAGEGGAQTAWRYIQAAAEWIDSSDNYVRFADATPGGANHNDALRIKLTGLTPPRSGEQLWLFLLGAADRYQLVGAVDGNGTVDATLPLDTYAPTAGYRGAVVTVGKQVATAQLPTVPLNYLATVMYRAETTPGQVGYGVGLANEAKIVADHAGFLRDSVNAGNLTEAKRHAEHILNTLYGAADPRYGDQDNDGVATNPGDGFGLLRYREQMYGTLTQAAEAAGNGSPAAINIGTRVAQVQVALNNIGDGAAGSQGGWGATLIAQTTQLLTTGSIGEAQPLAPQIAALADRLYRGEEVNDNGVIEPIAGEGGALTAYRYTQHAADFYPETVGETATATPTPSPTTAAGTPTPSATPTATPTGTITVTPPPLGSDRYEDDNQCSAARAISADGLVQRRTYHTAGDTDWVRFDATAGEQYLIEVNIPEGSPADVALELYENCGGATVQAQDFSFSPAIRLDYTAPTSGPVLLKFTNNDPSTAGPAVAYDLTVRSLSAQSAPGLLIIVAGQIKNNDPVQPNIYHVTDAVRRLFIDKGATDEQIYYLAPDLSRAGVDASATAANLEAAITDWADQQAAAAQSLTIYLMDHGGQDLFYLDKLRGEWITPADLDGWLDELEALRPTLNINIIYEACESGSFVSGEQSISKPGRVVISSTDDENLAWASDDGAIFSDHLLDSLARGESLYISFTNARIAAQIAHPNQQPWIDGDGDGNGTDDASQTVAAQRGFAFAGTFPDEVWPPFIAEVQEVKPDDEGRAVLRAQVRDDVDVDRVWAVIYPPSYQAPSESEELVQEALPTTVLLDQGNDWYGARFDGFRERGTYRVVFFADDNQDANARPVSVNVMVGANTVYLPLVSR